MDPELIARARRWGVALRYTDGTGAEHVPSESTVRSIVEALEGRAINIEVVAQRPSVTRLERVHARGWGVFSPIAAIRRSESDRGLGDLTGLAELGEAVGHRGGNVVGTLPLVACGPHTASPYSASSRRVWDERWIDIEAVAELLGLSADHPTVPSDRLADPVGASHLVRQTLARWASHAPERVVDAWLDTHPIVARYARWRAHQPDGTTEAIEGWIQWVVHQQISTTAQRCRAAGVGLYFDIPIGVVPEGFDVNDRSELFLTAMSIGSPPDEYFPEGQCWGLAPLHPGAIAAPAESYWREVLQTHCANASMIRLDHVMGLHRQFWVPLDGDGDGTYVDYPAEQLWDIVIEVATAMDCDVVGEDLGTVPPVVRDTMAQRGASGCFIAQSELRAPGRLGRPVPVDAVAALNTHDLETFAEWWPAAATQELTRNHVLAELAQSEASMVLVSEADLWLDPRRFNLPGSVDDRWWRTRSARLVSDLALPDTTAASAFDALNSWRGVPRGRRPRGATPLVDAEDLATFYAGTHAHLGQRFGAQLAVCHGMRGAEMTVWAPHAVAVQVAGDFDGFSGVELARLDSECWEGFLPGATTGDYYKIRVLCSDGNWREKHDPFERSAEGPPGNASRLTPNELPTSVFTDADWRAELDSRNGPEVPMSIYEVHLGSWRRGAHGEVLSYREIADPLIAYVTDMGFTHVELMGIMEHPFEGSWGYHVTGYFAPNHRYGDPADLAWFVNELHGAGICVILDWVPAHFPMDEFALARFDGEPLYEYRDPRVGQHPQWGSLVFNYAAPQVRSFLVSSARWWLERFHFDGLRVDAMASMIYRDYGREGLEWVPNQNGGRENLEAIEFIRQLTTEIRRNVPGAIVIAEESGHFPGVTHPTDTGGLGCHYKWDLGWMHDILGYLRREPVHRPWHHREVTFRSMYANSERYILAISHDEVVHGKSSLAYKMSGDRWRQLANLRLLFGFQFTTPGNPLVFMGCEFAQNEEWSHERALSWDLLAYDEHLGVQAWVRECNRLRREHPALHRQQFSTDGFQWVNADDAARSTFVWLRSGGSAADTLLVICNASAQPIEGYAVSVPFGEAWELVANSDDPRWGGSGFPLVTRARVARGGGSEPAGSITVTAPPLAMAMYRPILLDEAAP